MSGNKNIFYARQCCFTTASLKRLRKIYRVFSECHCNGFMVEIWLVEPELPDARFGSTLHFTAIERNIRNGILKNKKPRKSWKFTRLERLS